MGATPSYHQVLAGIFPHKPSILGYPHGDGPPPNLSTAPRHHAVAVAGGIAQREAHGGGRFRDAGLEVDLDGLGSSGIWADGLSQKKR